MSDVENNRESAPEKEEMVTLSICRKYIYAKHFMLFRI